MVGALPRTREVDVLGRQLLRSATSVGANDRAACRARSKNEFISTINVVEGEADESAYWLEMLMAAALVDLEQGARLLKEAEELTAIFAASAITAKRNGNRQSAVGNRQSAIGNRKCV